jgi:hypothetical protein
MTVAAIPTKTKDLPLNEQMAIVRDEINALDHKAYEGIKGVVVGKIKQQFGTTMFWYNQWDKNRDYSGAVNASLALGKLSSLTDLLAFAIESSQEADELLKAIDFIFTQCWRNIQQAAGRIVPFE